MGTTFTLVSKDIRFFGLFSEDVSTCFRFGERFSQRNGSNLRVSSSLVVACWRGCIHSLAISCRFGGVAACLDVVSFRDSIPITVKNLLRTSDPGFSVGDAGASAIGDPIVAGNFDDAVNNGVRKKEVARNATRRR
jgi:hypothetical protein